MQIPYHLSGEESAFLFAIVPTQPVILRRPLAAEGSMQAVRRRASRPAIALPFPHELCQIPHAARADSLARRAHLFSCCRADIVFRAAVSASRWIGGSQFADSPALDGNECGRDIYGLFADRKSLRARIFLRVSSDSPAGFSDDRSHCDLAVQNHSAHGRITRGGGRDCLVSREQPGSHRI